MYNISSIFPRPTICPIKALKCTYEILKCSKMHATFEIETVDEALCWIALTMDSAELFREPLKYYLFVELSSSRLLQLFVFDNLSKIIPIDVFL